MSSQKQPTYTDHHTPWRPDYPQLWLVMTGNYTHGDYKSRLTLTEKQLSIFCWGEANKAISKAMKQ